MRYLSTRGKAPPAGFADVLLAGLASDGGLYVPAEWPHMPAAAIAGLAGRPYAEAAFAVIRPFIGGEIPDEALRRMCLATYADFDHAAVAPLIQLGPGLWALELFHGPTLAFKDYAMQLMARLMDHVLEERGGASPSSARHRATPALRRSRPFADATRPTFSSSSRKGASRRSSSGR